MTNKKGKLTDILCVPRVTATRVMETLSLRDERSNNRLKRIARRKKNNEIFLMMGQVL